MIGLLPICNASEDWEEEYAKPYSNPSALVNANALDKSCKMVSDWNMTEKLERYKGNAIEFYDLMFNQNNTSQAINKYIGDTYIQHNPAVGDWRRPAFIEYFERLTNRYPGRSDHFHQACDSGRKLCGYALLPEIAWR